MPERIFSGDGLADSPVCSRSKTTILGRSLIRYRRLAVAAETSAARNTLHSGPHGHPLFRARSLFLAHLCNRGGVLGLQSQANPPFERVTIAVLRDALAFAVSIDLECLAADP